MLSLSFAFSWIYTGATRVRRVNSGSGGLLVPFKMSPSSFRYAWVHSSAS